MKDRKHVFEFADDPDADRELLEGSFAQMSAVNRWLGGDRGLRWALGPLVEELDRLTILDVGSGDGTSLARLVDWGRKAGCNLRGAAMDLHRVAIGAAQRTFGAREEVHVLRADALRLPFPDGSFDVAMAVLTLHHFADEEIVQAMAELGRVARRRVVVSDLERSPGAYLGARLLAATVWRRNRYTRNDGPASVRRGFTARELRDLGARAGLVDMDLRNHLLFRHTLVARGGPGAAASEASTASGAG